MKINPLLNQNQSSCNHKINSSSTDTRFFDSLNKISSNSETTHTQSRKTGRLVLVPTGINTGKLISITYSKDSTPDNPIMCDSNGNNSTAINDIDPKNASELEIQMLCAHLDATGRGTGSKFGTYNDLKTARMAQQFSTSHNLSNAIPTYSQRVNELLDWTKIVDDYIDAVKNNDQKQFKSMSHISNIFNSI